MPEFLVNLGDPFSAAALARSNQDLAPWELQLEDGFDFDRDDIRNVLYVL